MDHIGDMLHYLQTGLEKQGYRGIVDWEGIDRYTQAPPQSADWEINHETRVARAIMWAKDGAFRVTIEESHDLELG